MSDPVRHCYTRDEMLARAAQYMSATYGLPRGIDDPAERDRWHERYGMLVDFIGGIWLIDQEQR